MKKHKIGLTTQYIIIVCVLLLAVNVALGAVLMTQSGSSMKTLIRWHMLSVADTAAASIDGDVLGALTADDIGSPEFKSVADQLTKVMNAQKDIDIKFIYTVKKDGDHYVFTVDPDPVNPADFGEEVVSTPSQDIAWEGTSAVDDTTYEDEWGNFYTAWSPVKDSSGKVVGLVGVDFSADRYEQQTSSHRWSVMIVSTLSLVFGASIMLLLTGQLRSRIRLLNSELSVLSGDVEKLSDEIRVRPGDDGKSAAEADNSSDVDTIGVLSEKIRVMQKKLKEYMDYAHEQAYTDSMTGMGNKTAYLEYIKELNKQINEGTASFAIAVFDVNELKKTNDNYGHECGDRIIIDAAASIRRIFDKAQIFRIGGDEFIAVLGPTTEEELEISFSTLDAEVEDFNRNRKRYAMTLSLSHGGAVYAPGKDSDFKEVFRRADENMYADKDEYYRQAGIASRRHDADK